MCYWKQWRRPRTRIANLLKFGTSKRHAILTGISRKGYWPLSKTLAPQTGMTNEWLEQQGLLLIRQLSPLYSNGEILVAKEVSSAKIPENNWLQARYSELCAEYSCVPDSAEWIAYRAPHSPTCIHRHV